MQLVSEVIEAFDFAAKKKSVKIIHHDSLPASSGQIFCFKNDDEKLRLILSNLVSNAINFSYDSGCVTITSEVEN